MAWNFLLLGPSSQSSVSIGCRAEQNAKNCPGCNAEVLLWASVGCGVTASLSILLHLELGVVESSLDGEMMVWCGMFCRSECSSHGSEMFVACTAELGNVRP